MSQPFSPVMAFGAAVPPPPSPVYVGGYATGRDTNAVMQVSLNGTLTGGIASSPAEGDVVVAAFCVSSLYGAATLVAKADGTTDYTQVAHIQRQPAAMANTTAVFYRVQGATPDSYIQLNGGNLGTNQHAQAAVIQVWRNFDAAVLDASAQTAYTDASNDPNPPSITVATPGSVVLAVGGCAQYVAYSSTPTLSGWTPSVYRYQAGVGYNVKLAMQASIAASVGAVNPDAWVDTDSIPGSVNIPSAIGVTLALRALS